MRVRRCFCLRCMCSLKLTNKYTQENESDEDFDLEELLAPA